MNYPRYVQHVVAVITAYTSQSAINTGRNWKRYWKPD